LDLGKTLFAFTATRLDSPIWRYKIERKASSTSDQWSGVSAGLLAFSMDSRSATLLEYPSTGPITLYDVKRLD
jgi:hypothetical protein